jgi:hypothetical protein
MAKLVFFNAFVCRAYCGLQFPNWLRQQQCRNCSRRVLSRNAQQCERRVFSLGDELSKFSGTSSKLWKKITHAKAQDANKILGGERGSALRLCAFA